MCKYYKYLRDISQLKLEKNSISQENKIAQNSSKTIINDLTAENN